MLRLFLCSYLNSVVVKPTTKKNLQDTGLVLEDIFLCCGFAVSMELSVVIERDEVNYFKMTL